MTGTVARRGVKSWPCPPVHFVRAYKLHNSISLFYMYVTEMDSTQSRWTGWTGGQPLLSVVAACI